MLQEKCWNIIKDNKNNSFELRGRHFDDSYLSSIVCNMQDVGMSVNYNFSQTDLSESQVRLQLNQMGFKEEKGLYDRLFREYKRKTI